MRPQTSLLWLAIVHFAFIILCGLNLNCLVMAQQNVTVQDIDPLIQYSPNCPGDQQVCNGGWTRFFLPGSDNTVGYKESFAPGADFGFALPRATLTFRGSAIYWYTVIWRDTTLASVTLDNNTPEVVDLGARYGLNFATPMKAGVLAWSKTGLDPNVDHTIAVQYAGPNGAVIGTATIRIDYFVYTTNQPIATTTTIPVSRTSLTSSFSTGTQSSSTFPTSSASASATSSMVPAYVAHAKPPPTGMVVGLVIGGAFALGLLLLLIFWCNHRRRQLRDGADSRPLTGDGYYQGHLPIEKKSRRSGRFSWRPLSRRTASTSSRRPPITGPLFQPHPPQYPQSILSNSQPPVPPIPPHLYAGGPPRFVPPSPELPPPPLPGEPIDDDSWGGGMYQGPGFGHSQESHTTTSPSVSSVEQIPNPPYLQPDLTAIEVPHQVFVPPPLVQQPTLIPQPTLTTGISYVPAPPPGMMQLPIEQVYSGMPQNGNIRMPVTMSRPMHRYSSIRTGPLHSVPEGGSDGSNGHNGGRFW